MPHDETCPRLLISSGLHAGAECELPRRPFTIGADPAADVILHDEGVAPIHAVLEPEGPELKVIVRAAGVVIEDMPLEPGETVITALPVSIGLGPVQLRCEAAQTALVETGSAENRIVIRSAGALLPRTTLGRAAGAGLLGLVVAGTFGLRALLADGAPAHAASRIAAQGAAAPNPAEIQRLARRELAALELRGVTLSMDSGVVTATGQVDPSDAPKLRALELWFDRRFGDAAVLLSQVAVVRPEPLAVALQAVWSGPNANIVVDGRRYAQGATLPDGSVVDKIDDRAVTLSRHGRSFELGY